MGNNTLLKSTNSSQSVKLYWVQMQRSSLLISVYSTPSLHGTTLPIRGQNAQEQAFFIFLIAIILLYYIYYIYLLFLFTFFLI